MTTSSKKPQGLTLTSVLWMTGFFFVASAPYGTHAQQQNPAKAGTFGYVTNRFDNSISVIDTAKNTVVDTIPVGGDASGVAITPNGTLAYVANLASITENTVSVIKTPNKVVTTIGVGFGPNGVAITPDGTQAYVTNTFDDTVSVVDTASNKVVATIPVGTSPVGTSSFAVAFATVTPSHRSSEQ